MSKAGSIHLVRGLAKSLGPNIRVNAVAPGLILTEWADRFPPEVKENWKEATALKHVPYTEDIAQTYSECERLGAPVGEPSTTVAHRLEVTRQLDGSERRS